MGIIIDKEFQALIPPLGPEEKQQLEANLVADGCRDPLVVWGRQVVSPKDSSSEGVCKTDDCKYCYKEVPRSKWVMGDGRWECPNCDYGIACIETTAILIDGHNRFEICNRLKIGFETVEMDFESRDAVCDWIDSNQLGRRNLHPDQMSLLRGRIYNRSKNGRGGDRKSKDQNDTLIDTAEKVAAKHSVSPATIKRDGKFAEAVEKVARGQAGFANQVASGRAPAKSAVIKAAQLLDEQPERARAILEGGKTLAEVQREEKKELKEQRKILAEKTESIQAKGKRRVVKTGDWWSLGNHLLFCGDTSSNLFYGKLHNCQLAFADPPYGAGKEGYDDSKFYWEHDYLAGIAEIVVVTPGIISIFELAKKTKMNYQWSIACWINNGMTRGAIGFGNWIYGAVFSNDSIFRQKQDFCQATIKNNETDETKHSTRKPAEFMSYVISTFTDKGDFVIDPFLGSGQTLLTCETLGRVCIGGEIDEGFCQDIISRWESLTGSKAVKQ